MKIVVMATGGVGGNYGTLLARKGHQVAFIARGRHLQAIRKHGLTLKTPAESFCFQPELITDNPLEIAQKWGAVDWILFSPKTYDTLSAVEAIRCIVSSNTTVVSFQNGVENAQVIGSCLGKEKVIVAPTEVASNIVAPGIVEQKSSFRRVILGEVFGQGLTSRVSEISHALCEAEISATAVADGRIPMWNKFMFIASVAGLTALARLGPYHLFQSIQSHQILRLAMEEIQKVGKAEGVDLTEEALERAFRVALSMNPQMKCSLHLDLEQQRRLEIDSLSGTVARLGTTHGIRTPVHETIFALLKVHDDLVTSQQKA